MMVDDVELVEQGGVSVRDIGDNEIRVIRKERIDRAGFPCLDLAFVSGLLLASEGLRPGGQGSARHLRRSASRVPRSAAMHHNAAHAPSGAGWPATARRAGDVDVP